VQPRPRTPDLSATIAPKAIEETGVAADTCVHLRVPHPRTSWLQSPEQIRSFRRATRDMLEACRRLFPNAREWHLFYAGPAPAAVALGQQFNPTMSPLVYLYEYRQQRTPAYQESIIIQGN
jgi:hypothetical protein